MKKWLHDFLSLFYPDTCAACDGLLQTGEILICTECRHELPFTQQHLHPENEAFRAFYGRLPVEHVSCLLYYHRHGRVQRLIHKLKYKGREDIGTALGHLTGAGLQDAGLPSTIDAIVPVPMHPKKQRKRGYNQVTSFAETLSGYLEVPCDPSLLVKSVQSKSQSKKSFFERIATEDKGFDVQFDASHHGRHFLLVDDVLTTGATLESCGKALLRIPGARLSIVTMAMTYK
ncbi:MAG TPA: hypothetical protein VK183_02745 [Flavobacterium sp.]|nr:hypothetical protein [Flavobacterium sp.]